MLHVASSGYSITNLIINSTMTAMPHAIGSHKHTHTARERQSNGSDGCGDYFIMMYEYINNLMYCICNLINEPAKYTRAGVEGREGYAQRGAET